MNEQPVSYLQTGPRWANGSYSARGESTTIGRAGCGPTAMSMVLATWADASVTPKTECAWALAHGYKAPRQGTYYGYFVPAAKRYGLSCRQLNSASIYGNAGSVHHDTAKAELGKGNLVIACMGKGLWTSSGHYVLVWKIEGNTVYINDPASTRVARTRGDWGLFRQQVKYYWVIQCPENRREEPDMTEKETRKIAEEEAFRALERADALVREAMKGLSVPIVYDTVEEIPDWGRPAVERLLEKGFLKGTGAGLGLSSDMLRVLVVLDRVGVFGTAA